MIAIRVCKQCHREFDAVSGRQGCLCPLCEQGELFPGEFTDEWAGVPDIRAKVEEQYVQPKPNKKQLEQMFGMNCSMPWESDYEDEDDLLGERVLQQLELDAEPFEPLLAANTQYVVSNGAGNMETTQSPAGKRSKKTTPSIKMKRRANPYMMGDEKDGDR